MHWRLTTVADDYGRFDADPRVLLSTCFPLKVGRLPLAKITRWRDEMTTVAPGDQMPLIVLYRVKGRLYGQYPNWSEHQRDRSQDRHRPKPKFPGPEEGEIVTLQKSAASRGESPQVAALIESESDKRIPNTNTDQAAKRGGVEGLEAFAMTEELREWALKKLNCGHPEAYLGEFKDWWRAHEKEARKISDWAATFRNRLRQLHEQGRLASPVSTIGYCHRRVQREGDRFIRECRNALTPGQKVCEQCAKEMQP